MSDVEEAKMRGFTTLQQLAEYRLELKHILKVRGVEFDRDDTTDNLEYLINTTNLVG
jgi:hypothetical protein